MSDRSAEKADAATEVASDPSMDDILASIRRILDEEETKPEAPPEEDDVLELETSMLVPEPAPHAPDPVPPPAPPPITMEPVLVAPPAPSPEPPPEPAPESPAASLVDPAAAATAAAAVGSLLRTLASERSTAVHRGGPTIEDMVRDEIRPLLKEWLDTHLAPMVERLVRTEIERVVNRMH